MDFMTKRPLGDSMRLFTAAALGLGFLAAGAAAAQAASMCGARTWTESGEMRAYIGKYLTVCDSNKSCKAVTYVKDQTAPLQWSHRLALLKAGGDAPWLVEMTAVQPMMDASEGFDLVIDNHFPVRVPPEVISTPGAINDYRLNADLTMPLLEDFLPGANADWRYKAAGSKAETSAVLSLRGLKRAIRWVECMQK
jgi:hypothetical protein